MAIERYVTYKSKDSKAVKLIHRTGTLIMLYRKEEDLIQFYRESQLLRQYVYPFDTDKQLEDFKEGLNTEIANILHRDGEDWANKQLIDNLRGEIIDRVSELFDEE